jgi:hypothetical protein
MAGLQRMETSLGHFRQTYEAMTRKFVTAGGDTAPTPSLSADAVNRLSREGKAGK